MAETKTSILLGYECNNNCRFCYCANKRDKHGSLGTEGAKSKLEEGRERNSKWVDFLGGEPTIRNDIIEIISYAKKIGYETISITTNGKMLSYQELAEKIINAGLNHIIFSLHGPDSNVHDYLVRDSGAFEKLKQGMKNIGKLKEDVYICINSVIVKQNLSVLHKIPHVANQTYPGGIDGIEFIFPHPKGNAWKNFEQVVPELSEIYDPVNKAIKHAEMEDIEHIVARYVPFCYMRGNEIYVSEYQQTKMGMKEEHIGPEFQNLDVEKGRKDVGKVKVKQCQACKYNKKCEGIWKEYAQKRGTEELTPVP